MSKSINQHWVPQFYLSSFATSRQGNTVYVTKIKQSYEGVYECKKKKIGEIANLEHLYSLPRDDGTFLADKPNEDGWNDSIDQVHQRLERESGRLWKRFMDDPLSLDFSPGTEERVLLSVFLASLHLRNPRMIAVAKYAAATVGEPSPRTEQERDAFYDAVAGIPVDLRSTLAGISDRMEFLKAQLLALEKIGDLLLNLHWSLRFFPGNSGAGPLVTSDTPLFCVDPETMAPTSMESPECMVICPLTSRLLLIATRVPTMDSNGLVVKAAKQQADTINPFVVHFAQEEAYSGFELGEHFGFLSDIPITSV